MSDKLQKKVPDSLKEHTQYALAFGVIATMLFAVGFPMFVIFFFGIFAYFLWKTFSAPTHTGTREIFEFYLSANELLRDDDRRWRDGDRWRRGDWRDRRKWRRGVLVIGGFDIWYDPAPTYIVVRYRSSSAWRRAMARCYEDFRSFNPRTGYYVTYGGERRLCPYLRPFMR